MVNIDHTAGLVSHSRLDQHFQSIEACCIKFDDLSHAQRWIDTTPLPSILTSAYWYCNLHNLRIPVGLRLNELGAQVRQFISHYQFGNDLTEIAAGELSDAVRNLRDFVRVVRGEINAGQVVNVAAPQQLTTHGDDFRSVNWYGTEYAFTPNQAVAVKRLWEAWENGTPQLSADSILSAIDHAAPPRKLADVFRNCRAWGNMIVQGETKGAYRLALPQES